VPDFVNEISPANLSFLETNMFIVSFLLLLPNGAIAVIGKKKNLFRGSEKEPSFAEARVTTLLFLPLKKIMSSEESLLKSIW